MQFIPCVSNPLMTVPEVDVPICRELKISCTNKIGCSIEKNGSVENSAAYVKMSTYLHVLMNYTLGNNTAHHRRLAANLL